MKLFRIVALPALLLIPSLLLACRPAVDRQLFPPSSSGEMSTRGTIDVFAARPGTAKRIAPEPNAERVFGEVVRRGDERGSRDLGIVLVPIEPEQGPADWSKKRFEVGMDRSTQVLETIELRSGAAWIRIDPSDESVVRLARAALTEAWVDLANPADAAPDLEAWTPVIADLIDIELGPISDWFTMALERNDAFRGFVRGQIDDRRRDDPGIRAATTVRITAPDPVADVEVDPAQASLILRALRFPFIFSSGTSGGTRTTDVVVIVRPDDRNPDSRRTILYALMHGDEAETTKMPIVRRTGSGLPWSRIGLGDQDHLLVGQYAVVTAVKQNDAWTVQSTATPRSIASMPVEDWEVLRRVHAAAVDLYMNPRGGSDYGLGIPPP